MPSATQAFTDFPAETIVFLRELGETNEKTWFDAPRSAMSATTPARA